MSPTISLLTDFGHRDGYVGIMKGVIKGIAPDADVIDLSHDLPPQSVEAARFVLWNSYTYFPEGTIFVCVVDPGVGSARHIIALHTGNYIFIAPDNGLLDFVMAEQRVKHLLRVETPRIMRPTQSHTFHGRDIFAPAAAHLAAGFPFTMIGPMHPYTLPNSPFQELNGGEQKAQILYIDHFGNLITNLKVRGIPANLSVSLKGKHIQTGRTYADVEPGTLITLAGSHGLLEIACRNGRADAALGAEVGDVVNVLM